jgi:hypothetical protein
MRTHDLAGSCGPASVQVPKRERGQRLKATSVSVVSGLLFLMTASATHWAFYSKWKLRDGDERFGIEHIVDGTAHKPFVYRQLAPALAIAADAVTPAFFVQHLEYRTGKRFSYVMIYALNFLFTVMSVAVLRKVLLREGITGNTAALAACLFVLLTPYLQTIGGYFYDSIELFFLALAVLFAIDKDISLSLSLLPRLPSIRRASFSLFHVSIRF